MATACAACAVATTPPSRAERERLVAEVLEASGDRQGLALAVKDLAAMVTGALAGMADAGDIERLVTQSFDAERMYRLLAAGIDREFDAERLSGLLTWFRTPLGRRIVRLEVEAAGASEDEVAAFAGRSAAAPPEVARAPLLERLDAAALGTEMTIDMLLAVYRGIERAAAPPAPAAPRPPGDGAAAVPRELLDAAHARVIAQSRFAYRALTDDELAAYVAFLEQDAGRWFGGVMRRALSAAIETVSEDAARRVFATRPRPRVPGQRI